MDFQVVLESCSDRIAERWMTLVAGTYPAKRSQSFFLNEKDPFSNPVGHTLRTALPEVLKELIGGSDDARLENLLDPVIRVRAVQEFSPHEAVAFVFYLKDLVREVMKEKGLQEKDGGGALYAFDKRVDDLSLLAFGIYTKCREQIWALKSRHILERSINLLEKADMLKEVESLGVDILPQRVYRRMQRDAAAKKETITQ